MEENLCIPDPQDTLSPGRRIVVCLFVWPVQVLTPSPARRDTSQTLRAGEENGGILQSCSVQLESIPLMDGIDQAVGKPKVPHFLLPNQYCMGVNYNSGCDGASLTTVYSALTVQFVDLCEAGWGNVRGRLNTQRGSGAGVFKPYGCKKACTSVIRNSQQ